MKKLSLNVDQLRGDSSETVCEEEVPTVITGKICITRPTVYGTCCTP